jgi:hypothetical protein
MQSLGRKRRHVVAKAEAGGIGCLRELFAGKLDMGLFEEQGAGRRRVFDQGTTFLLFLLQVMGALSCEAMVKHLQTVLLATGKAKISSGNSAYCQARGRLPLAVLRRICDGLAGFLMRATPSYGRWHDLRPVAVDGAELDMADTAANGKVYPKDGGKRNGTPEPDHGGLLPKMNLVAAFDLFTGGVETWEHGSKRMGEQTLWRRLLGRVVTPGVLILGDALYCTFTNFIEVLALGGHAAFMARDRAVFRGRGRSARDFIVRLPKPKSRPKGWTKRQWGRVPDTVDLRVVTVQLLRPGFRPEKIRIVTTLLDRNLYPAKEIAALHCRRWDAELRFRDLKSAMGMDTLRCKTPAMIEKEVTMHMIALNLVRALSLDAASARGVAPSRLSFAAALAQSGEWIRLALAGVFRRRRRQMRLLFMTALADTVVRQRPGRSEPRAVKKRPKNYPVLKTARSKHPHHVRPAKAA